MYVNIAEAGSYISRIKLAKKRDCCICSEYGFTNDFLRSAINQCCQIFARGKTDDKHYDALKFSLCVAETGSYR